MKIKGVFGLIAVTAVSAVCMAASGGCGTPLHKADLAAGTIAATLRTAAQVNHDDTVETSPEKKFVADVIIQTAVANDNFIATLKAAEAKGGTVSAPDIEAAFSHLVTQVDQLESQGALHLKSAKAQADFKLAISSIKAELAVIQGLTGTSISQLNPQMKVSTAGISFTSTEIEELVALAITAGSALVPKLLALKGETDGEILTQAEADDAAAIQQGEQDGGDRPAGEQEQPLEPLEPSGEATEEADTKKAEEPAD